MTFDFKNASRAELKAEYARISKEIGDTRIMTKRELMYLPKILSEGEQVLAYTSGLMDANSWIIVLTDRRILFLDVGFFYGVKQVSINLDMINAISGETGFILGSIEITHGAGSWIIEKVWKGAVPVFTTKVRDAIEKRIKTLRGRITSNEPINPNVSAPDVDRISKLDSLSRMLEAGHISRKEFEDLKARL